jgi:hypothetical protein
MLRNRADQFGKNIVCETLQLRGQAQSEVEVPPADAQRIDIWYVPVVTRQRAGPGWTGVLAALAEEPAVIELWSGVPDVREFYGCLRKRFAWHHELERREKRVWDMPLLWCITAGRPEGLLEMFGFEPAPEGPAGHYRTAAPGWRVRVVVINELPRVRETLLLRLLGRTSVRRAALQELVALPDDALEREVALPWVKRLSFLIDDREVLAMLSPEDKEFVSDVRQSFEQWKRELVERTEERALVQTLAHLFERRLARSLMPVERETLAERVREQGGERIMDLVLDHSADELARWLATTNGH